MSELPTGTVTLLLADVEGLTRLWDTQPDAMVQAHLSHIYAKLGLTSRVQLAQEANRRGPERAGHTESSKSGA
ncbi:hypothetical protein BOO86_12305 [Mycobacterium sp. CBMA 234]|uniref:hypothetical protein n=1 Tax=Mycolicibacterium sp. CBMA 234 TaxID=1918495 RepID=UPI00192E655E|nr:hypothetical protein [Mycolicibacterium sp. CBMA 234]MUL65251.1 hypothetical protein [Mycolicibacterium sp. CBMA 234]